MRKGFVRQSRKQDDAPPSVALGRGALGRGARVSIAYGNATLRGYFLPAGSAAAAPRPVVMCICGPDQRKEDLLESLAVEAHARGMSLLLADLPGQGGSAGPRRTGRYDIETAISCWVDFLIARDDVAASAIALFGIGAGGALATRGAVTDDRFAAVVCDGGVWDLLERAFVADHIAGGSGWSPRSNPNFARSSIARSIRCPVLVAWGARDGCDAALVVDCCQRLRESGLNIDWRIFEAPAASAGDDPGDFDDPDEAPAGGDPLVNAFVLDWMADRLGAIRR